MILILYKNNQVDNQILENYFSNHLDKCLTFQNMLIYCKCFQGRNYWKHCSFRCLVMYMYKDNYSLTK